jgi:hypothetical protein
MSTYLFIHLNKVLEKISTAQPSSSSLGSLCFATDEDGCAVENVCNALFKCVYNLHEEIICLYLFISKY